MKGFLILLAVVCAAAVAFVLWPRDRQARVQHGQADLILITIDTFRADRVGRGLTPSIDALARRGARFDNVRAVAPLTLPSHTTIMTGVLPTTHGVRENGVVFDGGVPTLAAILKERGYHTGAFVGAYVLDRRFGLASGFDTYDDRVPRNPEAAARLEAERSGAAVSDAALAWLNSAASPFFLWVHLYDPHAPYDPPAKYIPTAAQADATSRAEGRAYDGEVAYADAQVGRILEALRARGLAESAIVAVTGDHGEALGEHGERTHGMLVYDATLRVPLVIAAGNRIPPRFISIPMSLTDVAPTLLTLAGFDTRAAMQGIDALGSPPRDRDVYAESQYPRSAGWHPLATLAGDRWKLVKSSETELYDLRDDPAETRNVASSHQGIVHGMMAALDRTTRDGRSTSPSAVAPEIAERLRALGYVSSSGSPALRGDAPNPASRIGEWVRFETALSLLNTGRAAEALPALAELATRSPLAQIFQTTYAHALKETGRLKEAVAVYRRAVTKWPSDAALYHDLAVAARASGDAAEAIRAEQASLTLEANSPAALNGLGLLQTDAGRFADAAASFERAATADPSNASYWANLGNARRELGDVARAEGAYRRALDANPSHLDATNGLGVLRVQQHRPLDGIPWFERALKQAPAFHEARLNLGIAYQESGDRVKAAETYRQLLATAPPSAVRERKAAAELLEQVK